MRHATGAVLLLLAAAGPAAHAKTDALPDWRPILAAIETAHERFGEELAAARGELEARLVEHGANELLTRLDPPRKRAPGYGVLPPLSQSALPAAPRLAEKKRYSLGALRREIPGDRRDVAALRAEVRTAEPPTLDALVSRYEQLHWRHANVRARMRYHELWQTDVRARPAFYAQRNALLERAQELHDLQRADGAPDRIEPLRGRILDELTPFVPQASLRMRLDPEGSWVLEVPIHTDIEDGAFLAAFERAIDGAFNDAEAARARGFRVALVLETIPPDVLYDGKPPQAGAPLVAADHLARFPPDAFVLTTGADSTHAYVGRYIQLGPEETSPRELAHEFGHLLGFSDAYLRGYEGSPADPDGMVIVEWVGLRDDLMGNSGSGRVSEAMVEQLLEAYRSLR